MPEEAAKAKIVPFPDWVDVSPLDPPERPDLEQTELVLPPDDPTIDDWPTTACEVRK